MKDTRLPWALGWASLGIGLTELVWSKGLCRVLGVPQRYSSFIRALGVRELTSAGGLLLQPRRVPWVWSRVAGDIMDLGLLAVTFWNPRASKAWRGAILTAVAGITVVDVYTAAKRTPGLLDFSAGKPSWDEGVRSGGPAESWRGSGLAEEVSSQREEARQPDEATRQRMMEEAAHQLGLDQSKHRGSASK